MTEKTQIHRHRAALSRHSVSGDLSLPLSLLEARGHFGSGATVFDYGCGRGADLRALKKRGVAAAGWDPYFAADRPRTIADVVNLGYVLNVIEDEQERRETLAAAWALTRKVLCVAVRIGGAAAQSQFRPYGDGVVTSRGTFQKFYSQSEFRDYVFAVLRRPTLLIAPGIGLVHRPTAEAP